MHLSSWQLAIAQAISNYSDPHSPEQVAQHTCEITYMCSCVHVGLHLPVHSAYRGALLKWCSSLFTKLRLSGLMNKAYLWISLIPTGGLLSTPSEGEAVLETVVKWHDTAAKTAWFWCGSVFILLILSPQSASLLCLAIAPPIPSPRFSYLLSTSPPPSLPHARDLCNIIFRIMKSRVTLM